ncbi:conserved hypothetical protein [Vibrio chagasii]|nr:putative restriction endonuclease with DUF4145 domain [Vibrio chagasii]CAH6960475.1 conserved hypothetical protein [Vibrio chagasii]CAH7002318.1 conserved hypothetical protein [Vibrio chagasii]CAH7201879.1 conserved hypothetical protein [Vibrio chagasii]
MLKKFSDRFDQLYDQIPTIESTIVFRRSDFGDYTEMDDEAALIWKVKVKNLLVATCSKESQHYMEFVESEKIGPYESSSDAFKRMKSVLIAAMDDYKNGYLTSLKNLIQADVFDSELEQAEELLSNGYKLAAAVIAGVVLETALRDICSREGISAGKLDKMNSELAKSGIYNKLQQKRITALADIRNSAAHGKSEEFTEGDVTIMIRDIEQFLAVQLAW